MRVRIFHRQTEHAVRPIGALCCALWIAIAITSGRSAVGQSSDATERVLAAWESQQSAIVTARIQVKLYRYMEIPAVSVSRDQFNTLLESIDLTDAASSLESLRGSLPQGKTGYWGTPVDVVVEGSKVRNNIQSDIGSSAVPGDIHIFNGQEQVDISGTNQQASIHAGRSVMDLIEVSDLRFIPRNKTGLEAVEESGDSITLRRAGTEIFADSQSGFVNRYMYSGASHDGAHSGVIREVSQFGPKTYAEGIVFPTITVNARYQGGALLTFSLYLIANAEFNVELPADSFVADAPAKTQIVDYRDSSSTPRQHVIRDEVHDVVDAANKTKVGGNAGTPNGWTSVLLSTAVILFGTALLLIGFRLVRNPKSTS